MTLEDGYRIVDREVLLDGLIRTAWSLRDGYMPNATIQVTLMGDPADAFSLGDHAIATGWGHVQATCRQSTTT